MTIADLERGSRTIGRMGIRPAVLDLSVATAAALLLSRLVDVPLAWLVGALLFAGVGLAALQAMGEVEAGRRVTQAGAGVPVESLILPAAAAFAAFGALRFVPIGLLTLPAAGAGAWLVARELGLEARLQGSSSGPSTADRTAVLGGSLVIAFLGFSGVAALVPGGMPDAGATAAPTGTELAILAGVDAGLAAVLGFRTAALRAANLRDASWFGLTTGIVIAIAAAALRAMEIPRLLGPALLVLVLFLWDALHASPWRGRDPRRVWESGLLLALGLAVLAWTLRIRG